MSEVEDNHSIWYVHPYAGGPGVGRYDRPYHLARQWSKLGRRSVILTPTFHHLMDVPQKRGQHVIDSATYEFLAAPAYRGNGVGRMVNMVIFTIQLLLHAFRLTRLYGPPAMIVASSPHPYTFIAVRVLSKIFHARCVFEVRDLWPLSLVELAGLASDHPMVKFTGWLERFAYRTSDAVVSLLPQTLDHMALAGLDASRWHYIPNGVDLDDADSPTSKSECVSLAKQWQESGRTVVVYAGSIGRPNHVGSLVEALSIIASDRSDISAIIVGRGELQEDLVRLVKNLGLQDHVRIFDQIPKSEVKSLLKYATAGFIALRPEPLFRFGVSPNKLFDYMLASLPVIFAIQAGNNPVQESSCGVTTDPGDSVAIAQAILRIAELDQVKREEMGKNGREYVISRHCYDVLALQYLKLMSTDTSQ